MGVRTEVWGNEGVLGKGHDGVGGIDVENLGVITVPEAFVDRDGGEEVGARSEVDMEERWRVREVVGERGSAGGGGWKRVVREWSRAYLSTAGSMNVWWRGKKGRRCLACLRSLPVRAL